MILEGYMHELSMVQELFNVLKEQAKKHDVKKVTKVKLTMGEYSTVEPSHLKSCFDLLAQGSIFENAEIEIEKTSGDDVGVLGMEGE